MYLINYISIYLSTYLPVCSVASVVSDSATPRIIARKVPLSPGFSPQEYWSELPCPPPRDLPNPGIIPRSTALQADSLPSEPPGKPIIGYTSIQNKKLKKGIYICICSYLHKHIGKLHMKNRMCIIHGPTSSQKPGKSEQEIIKSIIS